MNVPALIVRFRNEVDPEARSQVIEAIAQATKTAYDPEIVSVLVEALGDDDPVVQEWATVALRKLKGNEEAVRAMRDCFENEERESIRCCAIVGLGCMGEHLSADQLRSLYRERRPRPDDLLLSFAIHWAGKTADNPSAMQALLDLYDAENQRTPLDARFHTLVSSAALRGARQCLASRAITKQWLRDRNQNDLLAKLEETRITRMIEEHRARLLQPSLLPGLTEAGPDSPLVPGRALADVQDEQYVQDLAEWRNVRIVETRSYVRDRHLAREVKKNVGYACQICGDQLESVGLSRRFVHAHHVEPISEGGADVEKNQIVVCPNCHSRLHAGEIAVQRDADGFPASVSIRGAEARSIIRSDAPQDRKVVREQAAYEQILALLDLLGKNRLHALLQLVRERTVAGLG